MIAGVLNTSKNTLEVGTLNNSSTSRFGFMARSILSGFGGTISFSDELSDFCIAEVMLIAVRSPALLQSGPTTSGVLNNSYYFF